MIGRPTISEATEELLGTELVDFISDLPEGPDIIISDEDFDGDSWFENIREHFAMKAMLKEVGLTGRSPVSVFMSIYTDNPSPAAFRVNDVFATDENSNSFNNTNPDLDLVYMTKPENIIAFLASPFGAGAENELLKSINLRDLFIYSLFHEIGHNQDHQIPWETINKEIDSDIYATQHYAQVYAAGLVQDLQFPEKFTQLRALDTVLGYSSSNRYGLNGMLDHQNLDSQYLEDLTGESANLFLDAMKELYRQIAQTYPLPQETALDKAIVIGEMREMLIGRGVLSEDLGNAIIEFDHGNGNEADLDRLISQIEMPEDLQELYEKNLKEILTLRLMQEQPVFVYELISNNLMVGAYDDNSHIKELMTNFVIGAENLLPETLGVEGKAYQVWLAENLSKEQSPASSPGVIFKQDI